MSADTIVPGYTNPQNLNRYSYVNNNPINASDPTGHYCVGDLEGCINETGDPVNGAPLYLHHANKDDDDPDKPLKDMKPGDIITLETMVDGDLVVYNYMLGLMDDHKTLGFWDLDTHSYISYEAVALTVNLADRWTTFKKTDPKTFNSYEVADSSGMPSPIPSYSVNWTGGMDDKPAYVEVYTQVDWENVPSQCLWAVLGPSLVTSFWGDAKPTVTPLSQGGYFPLTNYVLALSYFATDGAALARYPIIHP